MESSECPSVMPDFCSVCGDKATKWRYSQYGATSCFSCRTFYRRSVENKVFKKYKCRSKGGSLGQCMVTLASRRKCAFCRYKKCRVVGMRHGQPHWVRENTNEFEISEEMNIPSTDSPVREDDVEGQPMSLEVGQEEEHQAEVQRDASLGTLDEDFFNLHFPTSGSEPELMSFVKTNQTSSGVSKATQDHENYDDYFWMEFDRTTGQEEMKTFEEDHYSRLTKIPESPTMSFTEEEHCRVRRLLEIDQESRVALKDSMRTFGDSVVKQFVSCVISGRPLNFSAVCWGYICAIQKLTRFALAIPEFSDATHSQPLAKKLLLLNNIDPMFNIRNAFFFQSDATSIMSQLDRFGIFDMSLLETMRSTVFTGILDHVRPMTWKQYFVTPWADSLEQEEKYEMLVSSLHHLRLDSETTCILSAVALFSTQTISEESIRVPLENIRRHQFNFSLLLYRYLVKSRGEAEASIAYPGYLATLEKLREMSDILRNKTIKIGPSPNVEEHLNSIIL